MVPRQSSDAEIAAMHALSERLGGFDERVTLEWFDGALAALAAGPRVPSLDEALPQLLGDSWARTFADPQDEGQAKATLAGRWRALLSQLDPDSIYEDLEALRLTPLILVPDESADAPPDSADPSAWPLGADWAQGFLAVVDDPAWGWQAAAAEEDDGFAEALSLIRALSDPDADGAESADRDEQFDVACYAVQDLRLWWVEHAPTTAPRRVDAVPGRNDPCPCGSGRKYKKCHGMSA